MTTRINKDEDPMDVARTVLPEAAVEPQWACASCGAKFSTEDQMEEIKDFWERHEPGDTVAAGECPECHALCFPIKTRIRKLEKLWDMLSDAIEGGRLTEADIPDDYQAFVHQMIECAKPKPRSRAKKSGVEYLAQHPGWKTRSKSLTKIELLAHVFRSHVSILVEYLAEAHEADRKNYVNGRSHGGDGAEGCSYCNAMKAANKALTKHTLQPGT